MAKHIDYRVIVTALIVMGALEGYALFLGYNGTLLTVVLASIAGIAGWSLPQLKIGKNEDEGITTISRTRTR